MSQPAARFRTGGVSLRRRVVWSFLTIGGLGALALAFTAWTFGGLLDARGRLLDRLDPAVLAGRDLRGALIDQESGVRGFALAGDERFLAPYDRGRENETGASERLQRAIGRERRLAAALGDTLRRAGEWRQTAAEPLIATVRQGGAKAASPALLEESKQRFDAFRGASTALETALDAERARAGTRLDRATRRLVEVAAAGVLAGALAGLALRRALVHWVLRPLDALGEQTRHVTAGEFDRGRSGSPTMGSGSTTPTPSGYSSSSSACTPRSCIPGRASASPGARRSSSSTGARSGSTPPSLRGRRCAGHCPSRWKRSTKTSPKKESPVSDEALAAPVAILLVEDDPGDVLMTKEALVDAKMANELHVVSNGEEALGSTGGRFWPGSRLKRSCAGSQWWC